MNTIHLVIVGIVIPSQIIIATAKCSSKIDAAKRLDDPIGMLRFSTE